VRSALTEIYLCHALGSRLKQSRGPFGQVGGAPIAHDPSTLALVDAWTWHTVSAPSAHDFGNASRVWAYGKADFTNEHGARSPLLQDY
jgi:hypothetical protein